MGYLGYGLSDNDYASDVQDSFEAALREGKTPEEINAALIASYKPKKIDEVWLTEQTEVTVDDEDNILFWLTLADQAWKWGRLRNEIKEQALLWIRRCRQIVPEKGKDKAVKALESLEARLLSEQPPEKKVRKARLYKNNWQTGDVYACRMNNEIAEKYGMNGRYVLFQKIAETEDFGGHIVPLVYVKFTKDGNLPENLEAYDQCEYVMIGFYDLEWFVYNTELSEDDYREMHQKADEYGILHQYRFELIITSRKQVSDCLTFVGNFAGSQPPRGACRRIEEIPPKSYMLKWGDIDRRLMECYEVNNLKQASVYQDRPVGGPAVYQNNWKVGDVYACQVKAMLQNHPEMIGRYILFQKIDEKHEWNGAVFPIVYVKITNNTQLPRSQEDFDQCEFIRTELIDPERSVQKYLDEEELRQKEREQMLRKTNQYGLLPRYRMILRITDEEEIRDRMIYAGNFDTLMTPEDEVEITKEPRYFRYEIKGHLAAALFSRYCWYNLLEIDIDAWHIDDES